MSNLVPFINAAMRQTSERQVRADASAGAGAAFLAEETLKDYYSIDLTSIIARLPAIENERVETADRLRRAALRAIDHELGKIKAERKGRP